MRNLLVALACAVLLLTAQPAAATPGSIWTTDPIGWLTAWQEKASHSPGTSSIRLFTSPEAGADCRQLPSRTSCLTLQGVRVIRTRSHVWRRCVGRTPYTARECTKVTGVPASRWVRRSTGTLPVPVRPLRFFNAVDRVGTLGVETTHSDSWEDQGTVHTFTRVYNGQGNGPRLTGFISVVIWDSRSLTVRSTVMLDPAGPQVTLPEPLGGVLNTSITRDKRPIRIP